MTNFSTVAGLIEFLSQFPEDAKVKIADTTAKPNYIAHEITTVGGSEDMKEAFIGFGDCPCPHCKRAKNANNN